MDTHPDEIVSQTWIVDLLPAFVSPCSMLNHVRNNIGVQGSLQRYDSMKENISVQGSLPKI